MATAVATPTVTSSYDDQVYKVQGTLAIDASPATYLTGGLVMNMNIPLIKASRTPLQVTIQGIAGYQYSYVAGSDNSNGKVEVRAQTASASEDDPLGELASTVAIPAGVSGDTISFSATWKGML